MNKRMFLTLSVVSYLPSVFFVSLDASSLALGLVVAAFLVIFINYKSTYLHRIPKRTLLVCTTSLIFIVLQSLYLFAVKDAQKPLTALFLPVLIVSAYFFERRFDEISAEELDATMFAFLLCTIILGWLGYFGLTKVGSYALKLKAVVPFSEESHYALCVGFFSVAYCSICARNKYLFVFVNLLALSLLFPSLTLFVFTILVASLGFARFSPGSFFYSSTILVALVLLVINFMVGDVEYFSSRLSFDDTDNLTTLVWLQGWDLALNNFMSTTGLGLGFQMLGQDGTKLSDISYKASEIAGGFQNLDDGGFVAAKLVAEFGVVGLMLVAIYGVVFVRFLLVLGNKDMVIPFSLSRRFHSHAAPMFLNAILFAFVVEFLFRGFGYFSPSVFFLLSAIMSKRTFPQRVGRRMRTGA